MAALQIAIDGSTPPMTEEKKKIIIQETYQEMYPDLFNTPFPKPTSAFTLDEVSLRDRDSKVAPLTASLATAIGPIRMNLPIFSAAMDTVSGPELCIALAEVGGCGILSRTKTINEQMEWLKQVLEHEWCIVKNPKCLRPNQSIKDAEDMHTEFGFSTIPITDHESKLLGILFTKNINYDGNKHDSVSQWMKP
ncbi:MAG: IMP dehydrogenase, partial [Candidatus Falkowbacteria bacterium]|nr:IMP dehydrogenase [Candidatus Falkowbacteria bacterium]